MRGIHFGRYLLERCSFNSTRANIGTSVEAGVPSSQPVSQMTTIIRHPRHIINFTNVTNVSRT